jgi:hypothetical protein
MVKTIPFAEGSVTLLSHKGAGWMRVKLQKGNQENIVDVKITDLLQAIHENPIPLGAGEYKFLLGKSTTATE